MDRREFVSRTLKVGTCACAAVLAGDARPAFAEEAGSTQETDGIARFIGEWTELLMTVLDQEVKLEKKVRILEKCGRGCAQRTFKQQAAKFKGNLEGFLAAFKEIWAETVQLDKDQKVLRTAGKSKRCACPLVRGKSSVRSVSLCLCSRGWMKEIFETVTGGPVEVMPEETIMTGGKRCAFRINLG